MIKQVIVLRTDLNMRKGKMAAQAAHASMKVILDHGFLEGGAFTVTLWPDAWLWLRGDFTKVVVGVESNEALIALHTQAIKANIPCALVTDAGKTEFHGVPTNTALAVGPYEATAIDAITGHLKLL